MAGFETDRSGREHGAAEPDVEERFSLGVLEFPAIVDLVSSFLSGAISKPALQALAPTSDISRINRDLDLAREARGSLDVSPRPSLGSLADPRPILEKIRIKGISCSAPEVYSVIELARAACAWRDLFQKTPFTRLEALVQTMADVRPLVRELGEKILPDGTVDSSASPALGKIRRSIERLRQELQTALDRLVRKLAGSQVLQEEIITLRNGRFVLPVRTEKKRSVEGIVHGSSSSGASVFIEPFETLTLNNELVEFADREAAEILRILAEFTDRLRVRREELLQAIEVLSEVDLAFAKAEFARRYGGCFPEFADQRELILKEARHPLLEKALEMKGRQPVPLTLELDPPRTMVVISGPNTGGKTVALKTVGVVALMAQAGLPVLAKEARLPRFTRILADIGDQQSIEQSLSTFAAHIRNIGRIIRSAGEEDLVLLDEIGGSTDPQEGAALAVAILERFRSRKSMTFVTTHHSRLKAYAAATPEALNAAMDFDEVTLRPTYKVVAGLPGKSSGLDIAMQLGLDAAIVDQARSLLNPAEAELANLVAALHSQRSELEAEREQARARARELEAQASELRQQTASERERKLKELDQRLERVLREHEKKWEQAVAEIRRQARGEGREGQATRGLRQAARSGERLARETRTDWNVQVLESKDTGAVPEETTPGIPPAAGDRVRIGDVSSPGVVLAVLDNNEVEVEVGRLRMRVPQNRVRVISPRHTETRPPEKHAARAGSPFKVSEGGKLQSVAASASELEIPAELNLIGETAEEARDRADEFLDRAYIGHRLKIRVVHGYGKGVLRKTLHEMFASHPHVERFYAAPQHEGGQGATIVELRK